MKNLKLILRSLISNHACVEGGRKKPWYFAVIMFVLSMILALVPIFVQTITRQGDSIVSTNAYQMDVSTHYFLSDLKESGIKMEVKDHKLIVDEEVWNARYTEKDASGNNCYLHYHLDAVTHESYPDLGVYYIPSIKLTDDKYQSIISFPSVNENGEAVKVNRTYSFILFTEKSVTTYIYSIAAKKSIGNVPGDYEYVQDGFTINGILGDEVEYTWGSYKGFLRDSYNSYRYRLTWQTTLIMLAINAGISIFMGFMLWVLTRGKNNLNWFGIWETQKIVAWTTISPAILTTGLGFLLSSFSQVMFPLLLGVRIMWLSMKLLRPENRDVYPPLKEDKIVDVKSVKVK